MPIVGLYGLAASEQWAKAKQGGDKGCYVLFIIFYIYIYNFFILFLFSLFFVFSLHLVQFISVLVVLVYPLCFLYKIFKNLILKKKSISSLLVVVFNLLMLLSHI